MNFSCSGWKCRTPWRIVLQVLGGYCVGKLASERQQKAIIIIVKAQSVQFSCSVVSDSATPWNAACQASLSISNSQSLLKLMTFKLVMPSNHLILCLPLLPPSIFPSIRVFSNESSLCIRLPKYWSFKSASVLPMNIQD